MTAHHQIMRLFALDSEDDSPPRVDTADAISHARGVANGHWKIGHPLDIDAKLFRAMSAVDGAIASVRHHRLQELMWVACEWGEVKPDAASIKRARRELRRLSGDAHELAKVRPAVVEAVKERAREHERAARALRKAAKMGGS